MNKAQTQALFTNSPSINSIKVYFHKREMPLSVESINGVETDGYFFNQPELRNEEKILLLELNIKHEDLTFLLTNILSNLSPETKFYQNIVYYFNTEGIFRKHHV